MHHFISSLQNSYIYIYIKCLYSSASLTVEEMDTQKDYAKILKLSLTEASPGLLTPHTVFP